MLIKLAYTVFSVLSGNDNGVATGTDSENLRCQWQEFAIHTTKELGKFRSSSYHRAECALSWL